MQEVDAPRAGGGVREASLSLWSWSRSRSGGGQELDGIFRGTAGSAGRMGLGIRIEDHQFYRNIGVCVFALVSITKSPCLIISYHR
jgi:hypothetical protein